MYYFLRQDLFSGLEMIEIEGHTAETGARIWIAGHPFDSPLPPQTLMLDPSYGSNFPDFFDTTVPVMSGKLLSYLNKSGVANIDAYPVTLQNRVSGEQVEGYFAVNVIACIDAVKLADSAHRLRYGKPYFTGPIVIDEARVLNAECFRLMHGPGFIVVSQRIAGGLMKEGFSGLLLQGTEAYEGI